MMQGNEIEIGGFRGRTNKLVDGCYSWWCGGAFSLLEALGVEKQENNVAPAKADGSMTEEWADADGSSIS